MTFGQKIQEYIYSLSTTDKYSEYDSRKSFNRLNGPDSETNLLFSHHNQSSTELINDDSDEYISTREGVHEVKLAWHHINNWLKKYSPDLESSLQDKCTTSDINEFQKDLNIKLPNCVIEFFKLTDGQSNFGSNNNETSEGLIFGLKLMSLDEIVIMTENWRKVAHYFNSEASLLKQNNRLVELAKLPTSHNNAIHMNKKLSGMSPLSVATSPRNSTDLPEPRSSRSSSTSSHVSSSSTAAEMPKQMSMPPGQIHDTFAHPMWIPIITDEVGNYIGIDLSPPLNSKGKVGQVILFGREFDIKFKIADNFGDFLLIFANDLEIGNWEIKQNRKNNYGDLFIGNEGTLVYMDKETNTEVPYLDALRRRSIKTWLESIKEPTPEESELICELKSKESFVLSYKNMNSVDKSISSNLSNIDTINQPINERRKANHKSSLSQVPESEGEI